MRHPTLAPLLSALTLTVIHSYAVAQDVPPPEAAPDSATATACGPVSLYVLCRLEGLSPDLATVERRFQAASPTGHSLAEIRSAARSFGLDLRGMRATARDWALDRPAIVFFDKGGHGHFVAIRPVGHTGKLVQVIDGSHSVEILDYTRLTSNPSWTGLALVPTRPSATLRYLIALGVVFSVGPFSAWFFLRSMRKATRSQILSAPSPD